MTGAELVAWRKRYGWTQAAAAHVLLRSRATLNNWEHGLAPIPSMVRSMCEQADTIEQLVGERVLAKDAAARHRALLARMADAAKFPKRGRPRKSR